MLIVGITGRSGSGKSSVTRHYAALAYPVADGDEISREITLPGTPCLQELADEFGDGILNGDGSLNRRGLADVAFASPEKTQRLTDITQPHILAEFLRRVEVAKQAGEKLYFFDGAAIVGGPFQPYMDKMILLVAELHLSVSRIILRDGISKTAAYNRLNAQISEQELRDVADFVIENNTSEAAMLKAADEVLEKLVQMAEGMPQ